MSLPYSVYKKVIDFYVDSRREQAPRSRGVTSKVIPLDFEGTKFDFLARYNPKIKVDIYNAELIQGSGGYYVPGGIQRNAYGITGEIALAGKSSRVMDHIIEHEVLHFVQDLIRIYARESVGDNPNRREKRWTKGDQIKIGGLPNKKVLSRLLGDYDVGGYAHGSSKQRRTTHAYRPIEQMTNLNSFIMQSRMNYLSEILKEINIDPLEKNWEELKKNPEFIKRLGDKKRKRVDQSVFKKLDPEAYKLYHAEIFKKYTDSTDWKDTYEILRRKIELGNKIKQDEEERTKKSMEKAGVDLKGFSTEDFGKGVKVKINYLDRIDFSNLDSFVPEEERDNVEVGDAAEEMFWKAGIKENKDGFFSITATPQNLFKLFNKIKSYKAKETEKEKICDWDYFAHALASVISDTLSDYMYKKKRKQIEKEQILSIFYPGPYEDCNEF